MQTSLPLEALIEPITQDLPQGLSLQNDEKSQSLYYQLKEARKLARGQERGRIQAGETQFINKGQWQAVLTLSQKIIESHSKDLEVCCFLIEASTRISGFSGLRQGLELINTLLKTYGANLYPKMEEDETLLDFSAFSSLNGELQPGTLIMPIKAIGLTDSDPAYAAWEYEQALSERGQDPSALERIQLAAQQTSVTFFKAQQEGIKAAQQILDELNETLTALCGDKSPSTHFLRQSLREVQDALTGLIPRQNLSLSDESIVDKSVLEAESNVSAHYDREALLDQVTKIAQTLREFEPHSPVSYALEQAVSWGQMSLPELTRSLLDDPNAQYSYARITGIGMPEPYQEAFPETEHEP